MTQTDRRGRPEQVQVRKVIEVIAIKGAGVKDDPVRELRQYWSLDGELLAEHDTWQPESETING